MNSLLVAFCCLFSACGSDKQVDNSSPSPISFANPAATMRVTASSNSSIAPTSFNLMQKLQAQGLKISSAGTERNFTVVTQVDGTILMVNGEYLTYYEFPDTASANAIYISPEGATFRNAKGATVNLSPTKIGPHVYKKENLIVLYIGSDQIVLNALNVVIGSQIAGV